MNVENLGERYFIEGLRVTRVDGRGSRDFTIYWDQYKQQWQWGMHGRLALQWLGDNMIAWVPDNPGDSCYGRVWRWQRCGLPPAPSSSVEASGSTYGPQRTTGRLAPNSGVGSGISSGPYFQPAHPWRRHQVDEMPGIVGRRSLSEGARRHNRRHSRRRHSDRDRREYSDHRDRGHRDYRDHRDRRDYRDHRHRWAHSVGAAHASERLPCGLTVGEVCSLLTREIRPEDYDLLLRLDETVAKPTASPETVRGLPKVSCAEFMGHECTVCLSSFAAKDSVVALPCQHNFHSACITKWLTECRETCPLCGEAISTP